jgi:hypothetical protein
MTISLCVIMLELTNDITLALPVVLALAVSKAAGDLLSESIYEVHVELMGAPYLDHEPPKSFEKLTAMAVMTREVHTTTLRTTAGAVQELLQTTHHAFPVVKVCPHPCLSEKGARLARKLGQLQPFIAVFPQECIGQLAYFGPTLLLSRSSALSPSIARGS